MASSSSAKRVARVAAKDSSGGANKRANWLFPAAILLIVALGIAVVVFARNQNGGSTDNTVMPRARLSDTQPYDHWHAAFAVSICGEEQAPLNDAEADLLGIHTHGDGLIHVHPFSVRAAGKQATLQRYFDQVGLEVSDDRVVLPEGVAEERAWVNGESACGGEKSSWVLAHWKDASEATGSEPDEIFEGDFGKVRITEDLGAYTLAFVPDGTEAIDAPAVSAQTAQLGSLDGGAVPADEAPAEGEVPAGGETPAVPGETAPGDTAPGDTTPTVEVPTTAAGEPSPDASPTTINTPEGDGG